MTHRPPTGLSKAGVIPRRNHQVPRKRPTQIPLSTSPPRSINGSSSPSILKKRPGMPPKRNFESYPLHIRGEDRNTVPGTNKNPTVRRVVGSRRKPTDPAVVEYKIQWNTSWEDTSAFRGVAVQEWQDALEGKETFTFKAQDGRKWTVLKDSHERENDSEDMQWEMWLAIRRKVSQEAKKDWFVGMHEMDFIFANDEEEMKASHEAGKRGLPQPACALAVLQAAWSNISQSCFSKDAEMLYGDVRVLFIAQLDPACNDATSIEMHRPTLTVAEIVCLIHAAPFSGLDEQAFNKSDAACTYKNLIHWRGVTKQLIQQAPFVFRTGNWMQLLALLLLGTETFEAELSAVGIEVQSDWCMRAREYAIHMYYDLINDDRPIHDIQETFLSMRQFFRELGPDIDDETTIKTVVCTELMDGDPVGGTRAAELAEYQNTHPEGKSAGLSLDYVY
jgi:hypothetical protein